ncbi:MAG: branched-chain amino acid ABC transporter permease [Bradyrhizobiaceae bacterium]|nr:branched-chain amino acid ABC transporter permease [Bradyrhizobiaceae bacterium]
MSSFITVLLDGLAYGMVLFIISVGLTVTMGLMRITNVAHGGFAMVGGYLAAMMIRAGVPFFPAAILASVAAGLVGGAVEMTVLRPLYRKGELAQVLLTFGLTFVFIAGLTLLFGTNSQAVPLPDYLSGSVHIGFRDYPAYRLFLIATGLVLAVFLWLVVDRSLYGAKLRAAVDNPRIARAVGINVNRLFTGTFIAGCGLAGFGGVVGAELLMLEPFYALKYLVVFLVVVVVGGLGNFKGSFVAALAIGIIDTAGKFFFPNISAYFFFSLVFVLLLWRPNGLMPAKSAA